MRLCSFRIHLYAHVVMVTTDMWNCRERWTRNLAISPKLSPTCEFLLRSNFVFFNKTKNDPYISNVHMQLYPGVTMWISGEGRTDSISPVAITSGANTCLPKEWGIILRPHPMKVYAAKQWLLFSRTGIFLFRILAGQAPAGNFGGSRSLKIITC